jgi:hypothetical protein
MKILVLTLSTIFCLSFNAGAANWPSSNSKWDCGADDRFKGLGVAEHLNVSVAPDEQTATLTVEGQRGSYTVTLQCRTPFGDPTMMTILDCSSPREGNSSFRFQVAGGGAAGHLREFMPLRGNKEVVSNDCKRLSGIDPSMPPVLRNEGVR